ncbi:alpha-amylase family glycosyl hydrolase [Tardisphaera miroshnichenkoae]
MPVYTARRHDGNYFVKFTVSRGFRRSAYVMGDFTAEGRGALELQWCGGSYCANAVLPPGKFAYWYEMDGRTFSDPGAVKGKNSLFLPAAGPRPPEPRPYSSIYQIFVDRFLCKAQGGARDKRGADLVALASKLDRVKELGFDAVYLTPVFASPSYHRYDCTDFFSVDEYLGGNEAFKAFLSSAHALGLSVILDMPIHHTSSLAKSFVLASRDPRYRSWYYISADGYDKFADVRSMPKLNYKGAKEWIKDVFRFWSLFGVDAFRIDVASGIPPAVLWELRDYVGKPVIAEVWEEPFMWRNAVDGTMNYQLWDALMKFLKGEADGGHLAYIMNRQRTLFPKDFIRKSWLFLGTHDTARAVTTLGGLKKMEGGLRFIYAWPSTPLLYYGDEVPLEGKEDPDNRRCMDWQAEPKLFGLIKELNKGPRPSEVRWARGGRSWVRFATDLGEFQLDAEGTFSAIRWLR